MGNPGGRGAAVGDDVLLGEPGGARAVDPGGAPGDHGVAMGELVEHGIRVNALAPGFLHTDLVADYYETEQGKADLANLPLARAGRLSELDGAILLLASNAASYMAGTVVTADAAHSLRLG